MPVDPSKSIVDPDDDPVLLAFLDLLGTEIESRPERLVPLSGALLTRMLTLSDGISVDFDEPIEGHVDL